MGPFVASTGGILPYTLRATAAFSLATFMSDKETLWRAMVRKYNLLDYSFQQAAAWPFGEAVFNIEYDVMSDTTKSRQFGFHECVDTEEMLLRLLRQFQQMRFIPQRD